MSYQVYIYPAREGTSKAGKKYVSQKVELLQSPAAPNVTFTLFHKSLDRAHPAGEYACDVLFYPAGDGAEGLTPYFKNYRKSA